MSGMEAVVIKKAKNDMYFLNDPNADINSDKALIFVFVWVNTKCFWMAFDNVSHRVLNYQKIELHTEELSLKFLKQVFYRSIGMTYSALSDQSSRKKSNYLKVLLMCFDKFWVILWLDLIL